MKLKLDANGNVVLKDGHPVYILEDGREVTFNAQETADTIKRLNGEAKAHREAKEAAEALVAKFAGIDDPEAARNAIQTVKNIKDGELITAGKVQEIKDAAALSAKQAVADATRAAEAREKALTEERDALTTQLNDHIIGGSFSSSKFVTEKLIIPPDIAQLTFGRHFKVEKGKLVPHDGNGNPIYSAVKHGEIADFDEAIGVIVGAYPNKDKILKGTQQSGGGAQGSTGSGGKRTITRTEFNSKTPQEQAALSRDKTVEFVD